MNAVNFDRIIRNLWAAFGIYWLVAAFLRRGSHAPGEPADGEIKVSDRSPIRLLHHAMATTAFILLFMRRTGVGALGKRFLPASEPVWVTGLVVTVAGLALAVWARIHLAANWSSRVRIRVGHQLIRTGPYAHLRHPIYTGVLVGVMGSAIAIGQVRALFSVLLVLISYCIKGRREDLLLEREFGDAWREHRQHAGFLLPRF